MTTRLNISTIDKVPAIGERFTYGGQTYICHSAVLKSFDRRNSRDYTLTVRVTPVSAVSAADAAHEAERRKNGWHHS